MRFSEFEKQWWEKYRGKLGELEKDGQFDELPFWEYSEYCKENSIPEIWDHLEAI